jgi:predicted dinucleotide-binding enzyme
LDGKIIIDATNRNIMAAESVPSAAEDVARLTPGAKVVKAFNTLGADQFAQPRFRDQTASMFICGDDSGAKSTVAALTAELGFEVVDCGPLANAAWLEALAKLWIYLARNQTGREVAFKLLRR